MSTDLYFSAKEAAAVLDVSLPTLYCYVSRGFVRTHRTAGERQSRYWRSDIEQFKKRRTLDAPAREASFGHDSSITLLTPTDLFYRGQNVVELSRTHSFESVAALLWQAPESELFTDNLPVLPHNYAALAGAFQELPHIDRILSLAPSLEHSNPRSFDVVPHAFARTGAAAMRWFAATVADPCKPSERPIHMVLARTRKPDDPVADLVRRLLVLSADHEMDPTTLAVRAVANTGVTPWRIIMAGLLASEGRRGSFSQTQAAYRWLNEVLRAKDPAAPIHDRLRNHEPLPGFGSTIYRGIDPRMAAMLEALSQKLGHMKAVERFLRAVEVGRDATGMEPHFGLAFMILCHVLGLSAQDANVLRLARIAGWLAHAKEQFTEHELVRPRTHYQGRLPPR